MIRNPRHRLILGTLELTDPSGPYSVEADGYDTGSAEPVNVVVRSLLQDGSLERTERVENRERSFVVRIEAPDGIALAEAEKALALELYRPNTLTWEPPDGTGPATVWDVQTSRMDELFDDMGELLLQRRYRIVLTCLPWGRSTTEIVTTFSPGTPSYTVLDDGSSAANWSWRRGPSDVDSYALGTASFGGGTRLTLSQDPMISYIDESRRVAVALKCDVPLSPLPNFVAVDVAWGNISAGRVGLVRAGAPWPGLEPVASMVAGSLTRYFFRTDHLAPGAVVEVAISGSRGWGYSPAGSPVLAYIGGLRGASALPSSGALVAEVEGSAPAPASLEISRPGEVTSETLIVYRDRTMLTDGWMPNVASTWGNLPAGSYVFQTSEAAEALYAYTAAGQVVSRRLLGSGPFVVRGVFHFGGGPNGRVSAAPTFQRSINNGSYANFTPDFLFRVADDAQLIYRRETSNAAPVIIQAPSAEHPRGGMWSGSTSLLGDALDSFEYLRLAPGPEALFVRWGGAGLEARLRHFPHWHSNAAI